MPEISIIVPVYKGVRFLRAALESVRAQTFADWECVCVDDGSRDGSGALVEEIAKSDVRIRVIHQENAGTSVARNTALAVARGKFIAFLDEDDLYHPRFLETLHAAAEGTGADVVGCDFIGFRESESPLLSEAPPPEGRWTVANRVRLAEWVAEGYEGVPFEVWRNLYRADVIRGHAFPPGVRVEQDLYWLYTLLPRIGSYVRIPWVGYAWRKNATGGYLHPDAASMISLTRTVETIMEILPGALHMDAWLRLKLTCALIRTLNWNIRRYLLNGFRLTVADGWRLRKGFRRLLRHKIDLRLMATCRSDARAWGWFVLTGLTNRLRPDPNFPPDDALESM